jgi:acyl-CoA synthetase (NDP forming)
VITPAHAVSAMLQARSIALVGASARPGSLGARMVAEVARSPARPRTYLVNPRYDTIDGAPCLPDLAAIGEAVDLVLLAVPDGALEHQLDQAARRGDRSAVIFGSAFDPPSGPPGPRDRLAAIDPPSGPPGLRDRLAAIAGAAGMAVCGAGCMGFVNVARGLRAIGYVEPDPVPAGPVALITHSGSVFSAMLRARRGFGFSLAVSSGQEIVTTAAAYARYALDMPETKVLALVLEAIRDAPELRAVLARARAADVPVVLLSVGASDAGRAMVSAHSGALAAADGAWEALSAAYGVHRVHDLAELADTLELFSAGRPWAGRRWTAPATGIATVHDSGLERAHVADLAASLGIPFGVLAPRTTQRLAEVLDPGLTPANPLDVWGSGRDTEPLFTECLSALAADPAVGAVALAVDLVPEFDGDDSYPRAVLAAAAATAKPVAVLAGLPSAVDAAAAARLRAAGVPVLEATRSGLLALRHLLDHAHPPSPSATPVPSGALIPSSALVPPAIPVPFSQTLWPELLAGQPAAPVLFDLLRDYGIRAVRAEPAATREQALKAAAEIGYPVVLKTDEPGIAHKSDVGGVRLGLRDPGALAAAYDELAVRLGPRAVVCETAAPGTELALGLVRDASLGPLVVVSAGGVFIEIFSERAVVLPPVSRLQARAILARLRVGALLAGARGRPAADLDAAADAIVAISRLAVDLGETLDAMDINPLICGPSGAIAADVLVVPRAISG